MELRRRPYHRVSEIIKCLNQPRLHLGPHNHVRIVHNFASDKLFADAAAEETEAKSKHHKASRITQLENEHQNWDGEESVQDAVLRMLIDKYKPLRTGVIQSADQKLKLTPPKVHPGSQVLVTPRVPSTGSWSTEPLLPSKEGHQPWHTEFKAPAHATSSVKHALFQSSLTGAQPSMKPAPVDDRARRKDRDERKRTQYVGRLMTARESTLDYRLGLRGTGPGGAGGSGGAGGAGTPSPVPVTMKGWTAIVEEKIEKARKAGLFQTVKGRGQPLVRNVEESNPFIAREEFLMNRIVQRNGAVPPWVEIQSELEKSASTFREILRQSWTRRVVRMITATTPPPLLRRFTIVDIKAFRDSEWEQRERSYHQVALNELNALVRKYNGLAPYAVRRPFYTLGVEMDKLYEESAQGIMDQLAERARGGNLEMGNAQASNGTISGTGAGTQDSIVTQTWNLRDFFKAWLEAVLAIFRSRLPKS